MPGQDHAMTRGWRQQMWSLRALSMLLALSGGGLAAGAAAPLVAETAAAGAARQQTAPPGRKGGAAVTLAEARKFLEGRWALESLELRPAGGGAPIAVKGAGVLNYDDFGNLNMEIRADQASSDLLRAAGVNIRDGIVS